MNDEDFLSFFSPFPLFMRMQTMNKNTGDDFLIRITHARKLRLFLVVHHKSASSQVCQAFQSLSAFFPRTNFALREELVRVLLVGAMMSNSVAYLSRDGPRDATTRCEMRERIAGYEKIKEEGNENGNGNTRLLAWLPACCLLQARFN